jgi:hypothetical protein
MARAEFARFNGANKAAKPVAADDRPSETTIARAPRNALNILLFDEDAGSAASIRDALRDAVGERGASDWTSDPDEAIAMIKGDGHDAHLFVDAPGSDSALKMLRA